MRKLHSNMAFFWRQKIEIITKLTDSEWVCRSWLFLFLIKHAIARKLNVIFIVPRIIKQRSNLVIRCFHFNGGCSFFRWRKSSYWSVCLTTAAVKYWASNTSYFTIVPKVHASTILWAKIALNENQTLNIICIKVKK